MGKKAKRIAELIDQLQILSGRNNILARRLGELETELSRAKGENSVLAAKLSQKYKEVEDLYELLAIQANPLTAEEIMNEVPVLEEEAARISAQIRALGDNELTNLLVFIMKEKTNE